MRLEILIEGEEAVIVPFKKKLVLLGTGKGCDLVLDAPGVSRRHAEISTDGDNFFVQDLESANGVYINEEKLEANVKVPFTSFFPLKLGAHVTITLLADVEKSDFNFSKDLNVGVDEPKKETTQSKLNLEKLNSPEKLIKESLSSQTTRSKIHAPKKPEKSEKSNLKTWGGLILLLGVVGYVYLNHEELFKEVEIVEEVALGQAKPDVFPSHKIETSFLQESVDESCSLENQDSDCFKISTKIPNNSLVSISKRGSNLFLEMNYELNLESIKKELSELIIAEPEITNNDLIAIQYLKFIVSNNIPAIEFSEEIKGIVLFAKNPNEKMKTLVAHVSIEDLKRFQVPLLSSHFSKMSKFKLDTVRSDLYNLRFFYFN
jgi:pSer/pThr/pTyr-binding forkhead associated (FHA) protein